MLGPYRGKHHKEVLFKFSFICHLLGMAILYYLVFCSALLKLSCYMPRNYFLATDWDAVTAVSVSENIHVQWRQQETSQVRYLTPGTPVKLNSRQVNHVSKPD